jgi:hypothetical protein
MWSICGVYVEYLRSRYGTDTAQHQNGYGTNYEFIRYYIRKKRKLGVFRGILVRVSREVTYEIKTKKNPM